MLASRARSTVLRSLRGSVCALSHARHSSSAPVTSGATSVYPEAPSPLQEFSVVYTDRALNHMSAPFKKVMLDIGDMLKEVYNAEYAVIIPGSGTYAMEACARQFASGKKALVLRNGYFSYRWSHIFDACSIPSEHIVLKARDVGGGQYAPVPIEELARSTLKWSVTYSENPFAT